MKMVGHSVVPTVVQTAFQKGFQLVAWTVSHLVQTTDDELVVQKVDHLALLMVGLTVALMVARSVQKTDGCLARQKVVRSAVQLVVHLAAHWVV